MGDWFIATEGVKIVKDSPGLWPQIITGFAALGGVYLAHYLTRWREESAAAAKQASERLFIATELVFLLEQFAEGCAQVATDQGEPDQQGEYSPAVKPPELSVLDVSGDWRTLPPLIMYRIRELPILQSEARRDIAAASEHSWAPYHKEGFQERQYQYARLGLKALILSRRLRKLTGLPDTRLDATEWSAQPVLWKAWQEERNRRSVQARLRRQTIAQMNVALQQSIKNNSLSGRAP
ncbi:MULTISPECIES: hypothetical protein [Serratia]|uniref:Uncharacterized protein n=1 Tax=Serratia marcescens TaxID=615 RepID=A0ABD5BSY3_SERMA|nr:hypothetical protein [Serratia marcescens]MDQ9388638.1 hypothetical protein [Serratia marcescens]MDQ9405212.1 hypothetical protein [Serratia marcescens]MDQ9439834.1 hypothetical protein [Serratia marcescens]MDQ9474336.1 hypothetical protein [Serratia marcescens]MDQ9542337.1 hypothetical protein [Serratia marcescens]